MAESPTEIHKGDTMPILQSLAKHFLAKQLARPRGLFGRYLMGRFLNRATLAHCTLVLDDLGVEATDRVLEVGFGGGALIERIAQRSPRGVVAGLELSEEMVAAAGARFRTLVAAGRLQVKRGSVDALPYPEGYFDKACSVNTVYFWPSLAAGLAELHRVLRPGGRLVLGFTSDKEMRGAGLHKEGFALYSQDDLSAALSHHGFRPGPVRTGSDMRGTFFSLAAERLGAR